MTTVDFFSSLEKVTLLGVFVSNNNTIIASFGKKRGRSTGKYSDLKQKMFDTFLQIALPCSLQNSSFYVEYILHPENPLPIRTHFTGLWREFWEVPSPECMP
jgi:hypothetical protein